MPSISASYRPDRPGFVYHFLCGIRFFFSGAGMLLRRPALLGLSLLPAAATLLLLAGLAGGSALLIGRLLDGVDAYFRSLAEAFVLVLALLLGYFLYLPLARVLLAPFAEALSRKTHQLTAARAETSWPGQSWRRAIADGVKMALVHLLVGGASIVFGAAFPPVGVPVGLLVAAILCSLEFWDVPLSVRGLTFGEKIGVALRNKGLALGFGLAAYVLLLIPVVNLLSLPVSVIGATLLIDAVMAPRGAGAPQPS